MAIDFNALRSRKGQNLEALQKNLEKTESGSKREKDARIWKPTKTKAGISENIIRFLPISFVDFEAVESGRFTEDQLTPMAKILRNAFQGPKGWYIENSLLTFGEDCPVKEFTAPQWAPLKGKDAKDPAVIAEKDRLKAFIAKRDYYANILVIKDVANPENNGKTMLYLFGETIREMIEKCNKPEFETDVAFDPFDPWTGANLLLNITYEDKKIGTKTISAPKWEKVKWDVCTPLAGGDEAEIEKIWRGQHSLLDFYDRKNFKPFAELQTKLQKVLGLDENFNPTNAGSTLGGSAEKFLEQPKAAPASQPAAQTTNLAAAASAPAAQAEPAASAASTGNSDLDDFEALLNA